MNRYSRRQVIKGTTAGVFVLAGTSAGCAGRSSPAAPTTTGQPKKPVSGGQLNTPTKFEPATFDVAAMVHGGNDLSPTVDSLLSIKAGSSVKYTDVTLIPALAEKWETADAQTYTFHMRQGATFANLPPVNGRAVTSADVKWSLEYLSRTGDFQKLPAAPVSSLFEGLDKVEAPDANTLVVHFSQPFAPFLSTVAIEWSAILAHEIYDQDGNFTKRNVGTGPWQIDMKESQPGQRWIYKKNPTYFQKGLPYIDQINRLVITDDATIIAAFQTKQLDQLTFPGLSLDEVQQAKKVAPGAVVDDSPSTSTMFLYLNQSRAPFNDARVRQAFSLSINRDEFIKAFAAGNGEWALAGGLPGLFTSEEIKKILKYDPAAAKRLLADAGYPNGLDVEVIYAPKKYGESYDNSIQLLQSQGKQAGFNLVIKGVDDVNEKQRRLSADFQLATSPSPTGVAADLEFVLFLYYSAKSPSNYSRVNDTTLQGLIEAERREADTTKRRDLIRQAVRRINEVPLGLATYYGRNYEVVQPNVMNYAPNMASIGSMPSFTTTWLEKQ